MSSCRQLRSDATLRHRPVINHSGSYNMPHCVSLREGKCRKNNNVGNGVLQGRAQVGLQNETTIPGHCDWGWNCRACCWPKYIQEVNTLVADANASPGLKRAGHDVVIFEQAAQLVEVGAGIQIPPNASRILGRLELLEKIISRANILESNSLRRWQDNKEIGVAPIMPQV